MTQETIKNFIETLLNKLEFSFDSIEIDDNSGQRVFQIKTKEGTKLIGNRGDTIRAINHIVKRTFENSEEDLRFLIDVNGYRIKKIEELKQTAKDRKSVV